MYRDDIKNAGKIVKMFDTMECPNLAAMAGTMTNGTDSEILRRLQELNIEMMKNQAWLLARGVIRPGDAMYEVAQQSKKMLLSINALER